MKAKIYPKCSLEQLWQEDKKLFAANTETPPACLRCGKPLNRHPALNAKSRQADVYVCSECGSDEALRDAIGEPLSLLEWHAVTSRQVEMLPQDTPVLTHICSFGSIFEGSKKLFPLSSVERPINEVAYSRSDYDGRNWWRTWFINARNMIGPPLAKEIDLFSNSLMELPEFKSLNTMGRMCRSCAQATSSPTDFYLYSETEYFYIWLQLVTRERDYNLYVHFYLKSQAN